MILTVFALYLWNRHQAVKINLTSNFLPTQNHPCGRISHMLNTTSQLSVMENFILNFYHLLTLS